MQSLKPHLHGFEHVIWDWNGTLLDDVELAVRCVGRLLEAEGKPPITRQQYLDLFCFPVTEYYKRLGFDYGATPFEKLAVQWIEHYHDGVLDCRLHEGAEKLVEEIKRANVKQSILSAAHEEDLRRLLAHFGILRHFDHIFGLTNHHAASKLERGRELIRLAGVPPERTVLIGDTDHDLEVGRELGIDVLLVEGGHQCRSRLEALHPRVIARPRRG